MINIKFFTIHLVNFSGRFSLKTLLYSTVSINIYLKIFTLSFTQSTVFLDGHVLVYLNSIFTSIVFWTLNNIY